MIHSFIDYESFKVLFLSHGVFLFIIIVMMPLWILYFGRLITSDEHLRIPNSKIATFAASLVVPLAIGILIKKKFPKLAAFLVRILKPFAAFLIVFIIIFAIYTNLYIFQLFTWQVSLIIFDF